MGERIGARKAGFSVVLAAALLCGCGHVSKVPHKAAATGGGTALGGAEGGGNSAAPGNDSGGAGGEATTPESCNTGSALAKARIWRLTDAQYVNAVRQLFGVTVGPVITDFDIDPDQVMNIAEYRLVNDDTAAQYQIAAKDVARQAVTSHYDSFMPCGDDEACAEQFVRNRIARAFGHRLDAKEVERYLVLFRRGAARTPQDGVRLMIEATLQSPSFLYRSELGPPKSGGPRGQVALTSQEVATSLAYTFTDALPDDELWQKADTGALADPAVVAAETERLLSLPETHANLGRQASYWLGVQRVLTTEKDTELFPEFTTELRTSLHDSSQLFVQDLIANGAVNDVVTSSKLYLNESLAALYGISGVTGSKLRPVMVDLPERSYGILSQPAVLTALAKPTKTDPIHRGLFVFYSLVCADGNLKPPPDAVAVATTFPPGASERELAALRADHAECGTCHSRIDPLGLLSERYDALGRYRESDASGPIDDSATLSFIAPELDGPTQGFAELSAKLVQGRRLSDCAAQNLAVVTLGRDDVASDASCALQAVKDALAKSGKFADFYRALATSPAFVERDAQ